MFKPGDVVVVRDWDELVEEYGTDDDGDIILPDGNGYMTKRQRKYCLTEHTISSFDEYGDPLFEDEDEDEEFGDWYWNIYCFTLATPVKPDPEPEEFDIDALAQLITG